MPARARTYNKPNRDARLSKIKLTVVEVAKEQGPLNKIKEIEKCGHDMILDALIDLGFDTWKECKQHYK